MVPDRVPTTRSVDMDQNNNEIEARVERMRENIVAAGKVSEEDAECCLKVYRRLLVAIMSGSAKDFLPFTTREAEAFALVSEHLPQLPLFFTGVSSERHTVH
jgi:hypothetical protein